MKPPPCVSLPKAGAPDSNLSVRALKRLRSWNGPERTRTSPEGMNQCRRETRLLICPHGAAPLGRSPRRALSRGSAKSRNARNLADRRLVRPPTTNSDEAVRSRIRRAVNRSRVWLTPKPALPSRVVPDAAVHRIPPNVSVTTVSAAGSGRDGESPEPIWVSREAEYFRNGEAEEITYELAQAAIAGLRLPSATGLTAQHAASTEICRWS